MKKIIVFLLCCIFAWAGNLYSQPWQVLNSGTSSNIIEVKFVSSSVGFITCNDGKIKKTNDGGASWNTVLTQTILVSSLFFLDENTGFGVGNFGRVFKTTNAGNNWTVSTPTGFHLRSVYFINEQEGFCVGDHGCILKTTNSGTSWSSQVSPVPDANLTGISFSNNQGYISVLEPTTNLFTSTNSGNNWSDGKVRSGSIFGFAVDFNSINGFLGGYEEMLSNYHPLIFKTNDNGQIWNETMLESRGMIFDVSISPSNPNIGCAVGRYINDLVHGNQGLIMRTTNGGQSWSEEQWPVENMQFRGVDATATDFYVVGYNGLILKTSQVVGISNVSSEIPYEYMLSQNYPNPFNPTTNINFSIPKSGNVKLTVYNLVGQEVSVILNQNLNVGNYTYNFDASNLTTGVYFYTLKSEGFTETKRMVLLK